MSTQPYQQLFHVLRAIAEIPESEINKLSDIFHPVTLPVDEFLIKVGEVPKTHSKVIIISRNQQKLARFKAVLPDITTEQADITDIQILEHIAQNSSQINILINNAGIQYNYDFTDPLSHPRFD